MRKPCYREGCRRKPVRYTVACHDDWLRLSVDQRATFRRGYDAIYGRRAYLWQLGQEQTARRIQPIPVVTRG